MACTGLFAGELLVGAQQLKSLCGRL